MNTEIATSTPHPIPSFDEAMAFVRKHAGEVRLSSGELLADHAAGTASIMRTLNVDPPAVLAAALFALTPHLQDPERVIADNFGEEVAQLVGDVRKLLRLGTMRCLRLGAMRRPRAVRRSRRCARCCSHSRRTFAWC
jgi:GTP pyrophosphokinase